MTQILYVLPHEVLVLSPEMPPGRRFTVYRPLQTQLLYYHPWPQVKITEQNHLQIVVRVTYVTLSLPSAAVP